MDDKITFAHKKSCSKARKIQWQDDLNVSLQNQSLSRSAFFKDLVISAYKERLSQIAMAPLEFGIY